MSHIGEYSDQSSTCTYFIVVQDQKLFKDHFWSKPRETLAPA